MKTKKVSFDDEKFARVMGRIRYNGSNATIGIKEAAEVFLKENGIGLDDYEWLSEKGRYELRAEREQKSEIALKSHRIVSTGRKTISEEKVIRIREMYLRGFSEREIAKVLKVGKGTVGKYTKGL